MHQPNPARLLDRNAFANGRCVQVAGVARALERHHIRDPAAEHPILERDFPISAQVNAHQSVVERPLAHHNGMWHAAAAAAALPFRLDGISTHRLHPSDRASLGHEVGVGVRARCLRERDVFVARKDLKRNAVHAPCGEPASHTLSRCRTGPHGDIRERGQKRQLHDSAARACDRIAKHHRRLPCRRVGARPFAVVRHEKLQRLRAKSAALHLRCRKPSIEGDGHGIDGRAAQCVVRMRLEQRPPSGVEQRARCAVAAVGAQRDPRFHIAHEAPLGHCVATLL